MKPNLLNGICISTILLSILTACSSGGSGSSNQPQTVNVPLEIYVGGGQTKYYAYTSAGGGIRGMTVIDTGSDVYFVSRDKVGPNVQYTNESVILYYDFGNRAVPGVLAYAPVSLYAGPITPDALITSSVNTPIVVTESVAAPFIGLMGIGMRGNLSPQLFFPSPYNQAVSVNLPESTLSFGNFESITSSSGASYTQLESQTCNNYGTPIESSSANCWNTFGVQIKSTFYYNGQYIESTMNGLLDTGSDSGYQLDPFPDYITRSGGYVSNLVYATVQTSSGPLVMNMTPRIYESTNSYNGGNFVNVGNNVFNYYQIIFDRFDGKVWFKAPAN